MTIIEGFEPRIEVPDFINAPVVKGQEIGSYIVTKEGQEVLRVKLVAGQDVPKSNILHQMKRVIDSVY